MDLFEEASCGPTLTLESTYPGCFGTRSPTSTVVWALTASTTMSSGSSVLARVIEPVSKLDTIRVLSGLGLDAPSYSRINRTLERVVMEDYRDILSEICFRNASPASLSLVLYDVTTLYFEIQREDEYRKPGLSKERRLEPQITLGLLVDRTGFP